MSPWVSAPNNLRNNVLLISNLFSVGDAYGGVCKELAANLAKRGWQVSTTSAVRSRLLRPVDMLKTIFLNRNQYSVAQIDVFSGTAFRWAELSAWALIKLGKPFVLTLRGGNLPTLAIQQPDRVRALLNAADRVTTPSRYLLEEMSTYRADIHLIPNSLDIKAYSFKPRSKLSTNMVWLRAFEAIYNPATAAAVLELLLNDFPDIKLAMFGPDKGDGSLQSLQAWIQQTGIEGHINILGAIPKANVPEILSSYDIFLNTTTAESFGVSVVEAAALGMCIVTTNVGELPYIWTHDHDALLVPPNNPQAMANAVHRILTEAGLAERLSRNARITAEQFDWSVVLPQWESLLLSVIE